MALDITVRMLGSAVGFNQMLSGAENRMSNFAGAIKTRLAMAFSVASIARYIQKNIEFATTMKLMADRMGVGVEKVQEWSHAAEHGMTSIEAFGKAIKGLAEARKDALMNPKGDKAALYEVLGFTKEQIDSMPLVQQFERIAEIIRTTDFGGTEQNIMTEFFGKAGQELLPAFKAGLAEAANEARNLGKVLKEDVVTELKNAGEALENIAAWIARIGASPLAQLFAKTQQGLTGIEVLFKGFWQGLSQYKPRAAVPLYGAVQAFGGAMTAGFMGMKQAQINFGLEQILKETGGIWGPSTPPKAGGRTVVQDLLAKWLEAKNEAKEEGKPDKAKPFEFEKFEATTDTLARIGGFTGTAANQQTDFLLGDLLKYSRDQYKEIVELRRKVETIIVAIESP